MFGVGSPSVRGGTFLTTISSDAIRTVLMTTLERSQKIDGQKRKKFMPCRATR